MIPILFDTTETAFTSHGIGDLVDCSECTVNQTEEGEYELAFIYPVDSELFKELTINRYVLAKPNHYDNPQIFQIYGYEKQLNGQIQINCQHISYAMSGIPVKPFKNITTAASAISNLKSNEVPIKQPGSSSATKSKFTFSTDVTGAPITDDGKFSVDEPRSMRAILLDGDDSIRGSWNGDLVFDNYTVKFLKQGGEERGVTLEYGVDITDLSLEENISEMITGVLPYYMDGNSDNTTFIYGNIQYASGTFTKQNIVALNVSEYFDENRPSQSQVEAKAREWMAAEKVGQPEITCTVTYADLKQDIRLYDAVKVRFPKMNIDVTAKVISYTYDVLNERCTEVEVSSAKHTSMWAGFEDAARLKKGVINPNRIGKNSIGSNKLAENSVSGWHVVDNSIGSKQLADNSVDENKIKDGSIDYDKLDYYQKQFQATTTQRMSYITNDGVMSPKRIEVDNYFTVNGSGVTFTPTGIVGSGGKIAGWDMFINKIIEQ